MSGSVVRGTREVVDRATLQRRLLLCLYGLGTNTGLKRVLTDEHATTYKELRYVRERFIRKDALREAIARVVNGPPGDFGAITHGRRTAWLLGV